MSFDLKHFWNCLISGIVYIPVTLKMTVIVFTVSVILALLVATIRFYKVPVLSQLFAVITTVYLGIPIMLAINVYYLIFVVFYNDVAAFFHLSTTIRDANFNIVAYFTLILGNCCMFSETFRGAYRSIDRVQFEAGYSIGMSKLKTLVRIILPQIVSVVAPSMINFLVGTLKNMSILFVVGVYDIMNGALIPCVQNYSYVEGYVAAALIYWGLVVIIEQIGKAVEKHSTSYKRQAI